MATAVSGRLGRAAPLWFLVSRRTEGVVGTVAPSEGLPIVRGVTPVRHRNQSGLARSP
jgi:hypothetical protein